MQSIRAALGVEEQPQPVGTCPGLRPMAERAQPRLVARWISGVGPVASATSPFSSGARAAAGWAAGRRSRCCTSCSCKWSLMAGAFNGVGAEGREGNGREGRVFSGHAGGVGLHASSVLSSLVCLFRSLCVVLNTLASWKEDLLFLPAAF